MIFPVAGRGRPRKNHAPDVASVPAETMLATAAWRKLSWRRGVKGEREARFAAVCVRVAEGPPQRIGALGAQRLLAGGAPGCELGGRRQLQAHVVLGAVSCVAGQAAAGVLV